MQPEETQQLSSLLDQKFKENNEILSEKLDKKFEENNKILKEEIIDDIGVIFSQSFNELETKIDLIDEKFNLIMANDDKIIKKQQDYNTELSANLDAHDRMVGQIGNHEIRIKKLELPV